MAHLHGQWFVEEFLVELFLGTLAEQDGHSILVHQWSVCSAYHLQQVRDWVVHIPDTQHTHTHTHTHNDTAKRFAPISLTCALSHHSTVCP